MLLPVKDARESALRPGIVPAIARDAAFGNTSLAQLPNIDQSPPPQNAVRMFPKNGNEIHGN
jgi:hypothetical protein